MDTPLGFRSFTDPRLAVIWGALSKLTPDELVKVHEGIQHHLNAGGMPVSRKESRKADAIGALREVARQLGRSPSVREYDTVKEEQPDLELPASSSVRTRLGGGWNDCLRLAQLEIVPDGDLPVVRMHALTEEELITALQDCARDLGETPTGHTYRAWASRPDVIERPGRRPRSPNPFYSKLKGWAAALEAAGVAGQARHVRGGRLEPTMVRYSDVEFAAAIRLVHDRLGRAPGLREYQEQRRLMIAEWAMQGETRTMPSSSSLISRYRFWAEALAAAGLAPSTERRWAMPAPELYSNEQLLAVVRRARAEAGEPFTHRSYVQWRQRQRLEGAADWKRIPGADTIARRFGGWARALEEAGDA